jgi:hypothetical protein
VRQRDGLAHVQDVLEEPLDEMNVVFMDRKSVALEIVNDLLV